jgi:hypothetical protein
VVAADYRFHVGFSPLDHLVGVRAIPNEIAQAKNSVIPALSILEYRLECLVVGVNVAED